MNTLHAQPAIERSFATATAHHQSGRLTEALAAYQRLRALAPRDYRVLHLGGTALLQLGRLTEAAEWLEAALRLSPKAAATRMCLGLVYFQQGKSAAAESHLRAAAQADPKNGEVFTNLGLCLIRLGRFDEGILALRKGAELRPTVAAGWMHLGAALLAMGKSAEALTLQERAVGHAPKDAVVRSAYAMALHGCHRMAESLAEFDNALKISPEQIITASQRLLVLHYLDEKSADLVAEEHRAFGRMLQSKGAPRRLLAQGNPDKRLRVAFLSPDLRRHAVAQFLEPLLEGITQSNCEVFLYHDHFICDEVSGRLEKMATVWRNFSGTPDAVVSERILADAPDVLVDLAGHTGHNRISLFASRLAPVQVTYLGYPDTTGLAEMDYRFTDAVADPEGVTEGWHTEELVRFSRTAWCYAPPPMAPDVAALPMSNNLDTPPVFGSFNNLGKLSPATWRLWARVLNAVPGSRLLLKGKSPTPNWAQEQASAAGLDPSRVSVLPTTPSAAEHLACYAQMDVALDSVVYNGTTTTCEALWMGRPVLTLAGDRHVRRVSASLLNAVGQGDCVATSEDEFVARAVQLVSNREALIERSKSLRAAMAASPLMDKIAQGRAFAQALRDCWRKKIV